MLLELAASQKTTVDFPELADAFLAVYESRLKNQRPQMGIRGRSTLVEKVVLSIAHKTISRNQAVEIIARDGFNDVVPRFHTLSGESISQPFYEQLQYRIVLDDRLLEIASSRAVAELNSELESRWSLLETAFSDRSAGLSLGVEDGNIVWNLERQAVTSALPILTGYQNGLCFYCGEPLDENGSSHVDHLIPRSAIRHDEIWNLVVAHPTCNLSKSDNIPPLEFLEALIIRNEYYIAEGHAIRQHLLLSLGSTPKARIQFAKSAYEIAKLKIGRNGSQTGSAHSRTDLKPSELSR